MFWAAPCVRIYIQLGHVRKKRCSPTFTSAKGQAFLTVPSFHQRSLSPCASRRTNSPTGLLGRLRLFMNRIPPPPSSLSSPSACRRTPTRAPFFALVCSPLFFFLSQVSFLSISQPRSLTSNWRHRQSHLDYSWDQPRLTSLPVKEETAIPGDPRTPSTPNFTTSSLPRIQRGSAHCVRPPCPFTQPLPTAQRSATTPIKGRSAGLLLPVGRLT